MGAARLKAGIQPKKKVYNRGLNHLFPFRIEP